jgi:hypothetical protein
MDNTKLAKVFVEIASKLISPINHTVGKRERLTRYAFANQNNTEKRIRLTRTSAEKDLYFKKKGGYVKLTLDKIDGKDAYVVSEMDRSALTLSDKSNKFKETSTMVSVDKLDEKIKRENWKKMTLQEIKAEIGR